MKQNEHYVSLGLQDTFLSFFSRRETSFEGESERIDEEGEKKGVNFMTEREGRT